MALYFMHWLLQGLLVQTKRAGQFCKRLLHHLHQTAVAQFVRSAPTYMPDHDKIPSTSRTLAA
ncbi:hypothetical protein G3M48_009002 [Beauveria asiatica]|uniref:Secreted protein n=1 Tax=Beauveria asiatica TaxID=1069075 RepID=A0AAW0RJE5_9HYPO